MKVFEMKEPKRLWRNILGWMRVNARKKERKRERENFKETGLLIHSFCQCHNKNETETEKLKVNHKIDVFSHPQRELVQQAKY